VDNEECEGLRADLETGNGAVSNPSTKSRNRLEKLTESLSRFRPAPEEHRASVKRRDGTTTILRKHRMDKSRTDMPIVEIAIFAACRGCEHANARPCTMSLDDLRSFIVAAATTPPVKVRSDERYENDAASPIIPTRIWRMPIRKQNMTFASATDSALAAGWKARTRMKSRMPPPTTTAEMAATALTSLLICSRNASEELDQEGHW